MGSFIETTLHEELGKLLSNELTLEIVQDDCTYSPRENANAGILCISNKNVTNETDDFKVEDHKDWDGVERWLQTKKGAIAMLPVFVYDHGGITISTTPSWDCWDERHVGYYYTTKQNFQDCVGGELDANNIKQVLESEIKELNQYFRGDVYAFKITNKLGNVIDFCGSYYNEAQAMADGTELLKDLQKVYNDNLLALKQHMVGLQGRQFSPIETCHFIQGA